MRRMKRSMGFESAIWVVNHHNKPAKCPECQGNKTLRYIGFVENYTDKHHGKLYLCDACDTWVDCSWPKMSGRKLSGMERLHTLFEGSEASV